MTGLEIVFNVVAFKVSRLVLTLLLVSLKIIILDFLVLFLIFENKRSTETILNLDF